MKKIKFFSYFLIFFVTTFLLTGAFLANGQIDPSIVELEMAIGESVVINKHVTTPEIPLTVDICLLEDETGSFSDDINNLQSSTTAIDIFNTVTSVALEANFAVAGFRDYATSTYGLPGDHVYRLLSTMSSNGTDWVNGIFLLTAAGGNDIPEAQYDAIVAAAGPGQFDDPEYGLQNDCGWRDVPGLQKIMVVATDAPFHIPDGTHQNDASSTITALKSRGITLVGLKAPGAANELDVLAENTGGSVQALNSDGSDIGAAILTGLQEVKTDIWGEADCDAGVNVSLAPNVYYDIAGGTTVDFEETISVDSNPDLSGETLYCVVTFMSNSYGEEGSPIGTQTITVHVASESPSEGSVFCVETTNPHGNVIPPAGKTNRQNGYHGENEDGFYQLMVSDMKYPVEIFVTDEYGSGPFGPYEPETKLKITESKGAVPTAKSIGSTKNGNGKANEILEHLILNSDAIVTAIDAAGHEVFGYCLVPPPPK